MSDPNRNTSSVFVWILLVLAVVGVLHTVFSKEGLFRLFQMRREVAAIQKENELLRNENEALRKQTDRLVSDNGYLERVVREELGYVRDDEMVFRFHPAMTTGPQVLP
jgi:cell division protein FtsB